MQLMSNYNEYNLWCKSLYYHYINRNDFNSNYDLYGLPNSAKL